MRRLFSAIALLLASALLFISCTQANTLDAIMRKGVLVVATDASFVPFEFSDGAQTAGIDMDIAQVIADKLGVKLKVDNIKKDTILSAVASGKADLGISALEVGSDKHGSVLFSDAYYSSVLVMVVGNDNDAVKTIDDLNGKIVGVQVGSQAESFATGVNGIKINQLPGDADSIQELLKGTLDAVIMEASAAKMAADQNPDRLMIIDSPLADLNYGIAVNKGNGELLSLVNGAMGDLKSSGELEKIFDKYGLIVGK